MVTVEGVAVAAVAPVEIEVGAAVAGVVRVAGVSVTTGVISVTAEGRVSVGSLGRGIEG